VSNRVIADGLSFPEGPAFDRDGNLYVVEIQAGRITRIPPDEEPRVFAENGGGPNGSNFGPDGHLYVCNCGGFPGPDRQSGRIERVTPKGKVEVILTEIDGVALASPNDLGFDAFGNIYFTDPIWGEVAPPGHVCFLSTDGHGRRLHTGLFFPNGIAVTPDGQQLIVCESQTSKLQIFDILEPGVLSAPREFAKLSHGAAPDGFAFDDQGNLLCCGYGSGKVQVFSPEGGNPIEEIEFEDSGITNLCFGGPENKTLYVTESELGRVVTTEWRHPGMILFPDR
jgi:gluconolactonase